MIDATRLALWDGTAPAKILSVNLCLDVTKTRLDVCVQFVRKANRKACGYWLRKKLEEFSPKGSQIAFNENVFDPEFRAVVTLEN